MGLHWSGFCNLERKLTIVVLERPDDHVHAHLYIFRLYLLCYPREQLQAPAEVHNPHCVGRVRLEAKRRIIRGGKCFEFAFLGHLEPVHVLRETFCAVGPWREELCTAILASGPFNLPLCQEVNKLCRLCHGRKAFPSEFLETHTSPPKYCNVPVQSNAANVVHKADIRLTGNLHGACLSATLQNDGADLRSTRCANGMAF